MVCIQEARLKAFDSHTRGRPLSSEYTSVKDVVETIFVDYQPVWSLADSRYAGTVTFLHERLLFNVKTDTAFSFDGAVDLLLKKFQLTREQVGLEVQSTTRALQKVKKQTSIKAFFSPKQKATSDGDDLGIGDHHDEGRFQFFAFQDIDVIQSYVPNNGTNDTSFQRRREWDEMMLQFVKDRRKLLEHCSQQERPLLWCGDFNVARDYRDGTHWVKHEDGTLYEFWTDPIKCNIGKKSRTIMEDSQNVGIPSFTPAERMRFEAFLKEGDFADVWRESRPNGSTDSTLPLWERPNYTWRGHLAQGDTYTAKFQGKGQRLDYFLLSPSKLVNGTVYCQILGYGELREGHFCGSDHCAVLLRLTKQP